jgi:hypothetical protein
MKNLLTLLLILCLYQTESSAQSNYNNIDLKLLETKLTEKINEYRKENGISPFEYNDTVKIISDIHCKYLCENGMVDNPNTLDIIEKFFGNNAYQSYNSNISSKWLLSTISDWDNIEERLAKGYMLSYKRDKKENTILVTKKQFDPNFKEYIGITCILYDDYIYVSQFVYITK